MPILRLDDCIVEVIAKLNCQKVAILSSAKIAGEEFMRAFYERLVNANGCKVRVFGTMATLEFSPITLANQPCSKDLRRKHLWTFLEEVLNMEDYAEVVFNCSVEMVRMIGARAVQEPVKTKRKLILTVDAMSLHIEAIVRACRG